VQTHQTYKESKTNALIEHIRNYVISENIHNLLHAKSILETNELKISVKAKKRLLRYTQANISGSYDITIIFYTLSWLLTFRSHPPNYGRFRRFLNTKVRKFQLYTVGRISGINHLPEEIRIWLKMDVIMLLLGLPSIILEHNKLRVLTHLERNAISHALARSLAHTVNFFPDKKFDVKLLKNLSLSHNGAKKSKFPLSRLNRAATLANSIPNNDKNYPYIQMRILRNKLIIVSSMSSEELSKIIDYARTLKSLISERSRKFEVMFFEILHESASRLHYIGQRSRAIIEYQNCLQILSDSESSDLKWTPFDPVWKSNVRRIVNIELSKALMEECRYSEVQEYLNTSIDLTEISLNQSNYLPNFSIIELMCLKANLSLIRENYSQSSDHIDAILQHLDMLPSDIKKLSEIDSIIPFSPTLPGLVSAIMNRSKISAKVLDIQLKAQRMSYLYNQKWPLIIIMKVHFTYLKTSIDQLKSDSNGKSPDLSTILASIPEISSFHYRLNQACEYHSNHLRDLLLNGDYYVQILESLETDVDSIPDILFLRDFASLIYSLVGLSCEEQQRPESHRFLSRALEITALELDTKVNVAPYSAFSVLNSYSNALAASVTGLSSSAKEFIDLIHVVDVILLKLESVRCTYLDSEERARLEALLENAYSELSSSLLLHLSVPSHSKETKATSVRAMLGFLDRSRLRWALSLMPNPKPLLEFSTKIPQSLIDDYLQSKRNLVLSRGDFFSIKLDSDHLGIPEVQALTGEILARSIGRLGKPGSIPVNFEPESFQGRTSEEKYVSECLLAFREATKKIQSIEPLFEPDLIANHTRSIVECFQSESSVAQLHIQIVGANLVVAVHFQSTNFFVLEPAEIRRLSELESWVSEWLAPIDFSLDADSQDDPFEISNPLIDFAERLAELLGLLPRDHVKQLRIFFDPKLSWLPLHLLRVRNSCEDHYLLENFNFTYSPSLSLVPKSEPDVPNTDLTALVASIGDDLRFARMEGCVIWAETAKTIRLSDEEVTFKNIVSESRDVFIFHFCGHTRSGSEIIDHHLDTSGFEKLSVRRCLDTVRLLNSPLVVINACRASLLDRVARDQPPIPSPTSRVKFEEGLATEQLSLATAFLLSGASVVIGTVAEVGDLPAALFAWKFSKFYQIQERPRSTTTAFRSTIDWLRKGIKSGWELENLIYPEFLAEARIRGKLDNSLIEFCNQEVASIGKRFPDSPPFSHPRHWGPFVLHR
jgi:CHAT domain-containing protein